MRTPEHFYQLTAAQLGIDLELVKKINKYFWKYGVRKNMGNGEHPVLYVKGLGTFFASPKRIRQALRVSIKHLRLLRINTKLKEEKRLELIKIREQVIADLLVLRNQTALSLCTAKQRKKQFSEQVS